MVRLIIISIFMIYFQYFFSSGLGLLNTVPNLLLPVVIYFSATRSNITGLILSFILGVILDVNIPSTFGVSTLLFVILGFVFGGLKSKINREHKVFILLLVFFANFFYFLFSNLFFVIFQQNIAIPFIKVLFLTFYNFCYSVIMIFLIFLIDNLKIYISENR